MRTIPVKTLTQLLTRAEVAARVGFAPSTIAKWTKNKLAGWPQPIKVGPHRQHRWRAADVELFIDHQARNPSPKRLRGALAREARS